MINPNDSQTGQPEGLPEPSVEIGQYVPSENDKYRFEVTERAVRQMRPWLVRATKESYTTGPILLDDDGKPKKVISPHRWCCRFRDAILGLRRYHYEIDGLDPNFRWDTIKVHEKRGDLVCVTNFHKPKAESSDIVLDSEEVAKIKEEAAKYTELTHGDNLEKAAEAILDKILGPKQP